MTACALTYTPFKALDLLDIIEHVSPVSRALQRCCHGMLLELSCQVLQRKLHPLHAFALNPHLRQWCI
jgi:hypothetical protein